ncbi:hypothetical protein BJ508DRAFT_87424 [Ascobolus immersus RN42]|uniref:Uncharacterized protein n=1 Tax=Ascobolus immersus RN42 TaxID=1160509 RepID=A0A3N4IEL5_ASCIM|nr:hypothetical protein BJ508DRAFT_87424 [Ascobolus immersus RN42]
MRLMDGLFLSNSVIREARKLTWKVPVRKYEILQFSSDLVCLWAHIRYPGQQSFFTGILLSIKLGRAGWSSGRDLWLVFHMRLGTPLWIVGSTPTLSSFLCLGLLLHAIQAFPMFVLLCFFQ